MASTDDWSTNPNDNITIGGINIAENCPAGNLNNAIREMMSELKVKLDDTDDKIVELDDNMDPTLKAIAALVGRADTFPYFTGDDIAALTPLTLFARNFLGSPNATVAAEAIGAVRLVDAKIAANGYVELSLSGPDTLKIQWGQATFVSNGYTTVNYLKAHKKFSRAVVSGANIDTGARDNDPATASSGLSSFAVFSASQNYVVGQWLSVGV